MKKGLLIIFSGPSGVGKGTILKELMPMEELRLCYSVSMTTRQPREGEVDGVSYFFVSRERFLDAIKNNELLEHAEYVGNFYGTPRAYVEEKRAAGYNVILEIETDGAKQIIANNDDAVSIFITPPDIDELENRIRNRKTEDEATIAKRLAKARLELERVDIYDYVVCNDDLMTAVEDVKKAILKEMNED